MLQLGCGYPATLQRHAQRNFVVSSAASVCVDPVTSTAVTLRQQQQQLPLSHPHQRRTRKHQLAYGPEDFTVEHVADCVVHDQLSSTLRQQQQELLHKQACKQDASDSRADRSQQSVFPGTLVHTHTRRRRRRRTNGSGHAADFSSTQPSSSSFPCNTRSSDDTASTSRSYGSSSSDRFGRQHHQTSRPWTPFHSKLLQSLRNEQLLPQRARVLVAVSGGQDSMAMVRLLHDISTQQHWPLQLVVGHCDHRIRHDSAQNAAHVQQWCQQQGLQYRQVVADRQQGDWSEAAARDWRHQQLAHMADEARCSFVALGHTATERAETVLFNLIRGAGITGLGAMGWARRLTGGLQLIRPLLGFERHETLRTCVLTNTEVYPDTTNMDQRYMRNRLRLSVFPMLTSINRAAVEHMCSTAEMAHLEGEFVSSLAAMQLTQALVPCAITRPACDEDSKQQAASLRRMQAHTSRLAAVQGSEERLQAAVPEELAAAKPLATAAGAGAAAEGGVASVLGSSTSCMPFTSSCPAGDAVLQPSMRQNRHLQPAQQGQFPTWPEWSAHLSQLPLVQQQQQQQQSTHPEQVLHEPTSLPDRRSQLLSVDALHMLVLERQHPALQRRVTYMWLARQADKSVRASQVVEVLKLLRPGCSTGDKTSTLWGRSCVVRYRELLLLLDTHTAHQVLSGQLQVHAAPAGADSTRGDAVVMSQGKAAA